MIIKINATGAERKRLVNCISGWLDVPAKYCGAPTFRYEVDGLYIERDGSLNIDDRTDSELVEGLLEHIYNEGFDIDQSHGADELEDTASQDNTNIPEHPVDEKFESDCNKKEPGLTVLVPTDDVSMANLKNLLTAKGTLIKKALRIDDLPIETKGERISFPWFPGAPDSDTIHAYTSFISALCKMSKEQKRISAKENPTENEKYAFRCFLLRLGFIGKEYKTTRKILLQNLTGSSAWKMGKVKE